VILNSSLARESFMLCSIVIPLYNKAAFIEEALQSIFNQTYQNFEVIVVDDGSKDGGAERVKTVKDHRVTLVHQANGGVSKARNSGIDLAKGDLVCFLDADDWYQPQYLETIVSMAKTYPEVSFYGTFYRLVNIDEGTEKFWNIADERNIEIIDDLFKRWRLGTLFTINSVAIKRSLLLQFKPYFPVGEQMGEDQDLYFRLAEKSSCAYCPLPLSAYRIEVTESLCASYQGNALFPAYLRLEQRALNRQMPDILRSSALELVSYAKITVARDMLMREQRCQGFRQLLGAWRGMVLRRWWVTLAMCVVATPAVVKRWEDWRQQRAYTKHLSK
jgi:glycosyltransferase involved in cell wall biosynthesis